MTHHPHLAEDVLEQYCLGTLPVEESESVREHTLVCGQCQDRLRETERFVKTMQIALARANSASLERRPRHRFRVPLAWVSGAAALACLWVIAPRLHLASKTTPLAVQLALTRGGESPLRALAPAGRPLLLQLDLRGVPQRDSYRVQMVDARGRELLQSRAVGSGTSLSLAAPGRFARGLYWVRLCDPAPSGPVLREFGLELQ